MNKLKYILAGCFIVAIFSCNKKEADLPEPSAQPDSHKNGKSHSCPNSIIQVLYENIQINHFGDIPYSLKNDSNFNDTLRPGESIYFSGGLTEVTYTDQKNVNNPTIEVANRIVDSEVDIVSYYTPRGIVSLFSYEDFEYNDNCTIKLFAPSYIPLDEHCDNNIYEPELGELNVDCGGYCKPCSDPILKCSVPENTFEFDLISGGTLDKEYARYSDFIDHRVSISSDKSDRFFTFWFFMDNLPDSTIKLKTGGGGDDYTVRLQFRQPPASTFRASHDQEVFLVKNGPNSWVLKYCDIEFKYENYVVIGSGNLPFETK